MAIRVRYEPSALALAQAGSVVGQGQLAKETQRFREQQRQYNQKMAQQQLEHAQRLAEQQRQFDETQDFRDRGLDEGTRRFDLGYGLDRDRFAAVQQQFDIDDWFRRRQLGEGTRRFNLGLQSDYARMAQQNAQFGASLGQRQAEIDALNRYRGASLGQAAHQAELGRQHAFDLGLQQHDLASQRIGQQHSNLQELQDQQRIHREAKSQWDAIVADQRRGVLDSAQYDEAIAKWHEQWGPQGVTSPYEPPDTRTPGQLWWDDKVPDSPAVAPEGYTGPTKQDGYFNFETGAAEFPGWVTRQQKESHDSALESQEVVRRAKEQELRLLEEQASETRRVNRDNEIQTKREQRQKEYQANLQAEEDRYDREIEDFNEAGTRTWIWRTERAQSDPVTKEQVDQWARDPRYMRNGEGRLPPELRGGPFEGDAYADEKEKAHLEELFKLRDDHIARQAEIKKDAETSFSSDLASVPMDNKFNTGTPEEASDAFTAKLNDPKDGIGIGEIVQISGHTVRVTPTLHAAAMEYQRAPDGPMGSIERDNKKALLTVLVQEIRAAREKL